MQLGCLQYIQFIQIVSSGNCVMRCLPRPLQTSDAMRVRCLEALELITYLQAFSCLPSATDLGQLPRLFTDDSTMAEAAVGGWASQRGVCHHMWGQAAWGWHRGCIVSMNLLGKHPDRVAPMRAVLVAFVGAEQGAGEKGGGPWGSCHVCPQTAPPCGRQRGGVR